MERDKIDKSWSIILKVLALILVIGFLYLIREVITILLVAIVITAALNPIIRRVQSFNVSRTYAVIFVYLIFFLMLGTLISSVVPVLLHQFQEFFKTFPDLLDEFVPESFNLSEKLKSANLEGSLFSSLDSILFGAISFMTGVISSLAIVSLSFYMSLQENGLKRFIILLTPNRHRKYIACSVDKIYSSFGRWMTGLFITMIFVGVMYYVGLSVLSVPFAIVLALIGGLLEIIPYFGPIIAGIPAIILGFSESSLVGFSVFLIYWLINLIENHILIPKIMNKAVGLNPVLIILALLIGGKLGGVLGLFLAVPLAGAVNVLVKDFLETREEI